MVKVLLVLMVLGFSSPSMAGNEGNSVAYYGSFSFLSVSDPDGSTEPASMLSPFHLAWHSQIDRDARYSVEATFASFKLDASPSNIGQEIKEIDFLYSYQKKFNLTKSFKPYLGIGASFSQFEATARYNVDAAGFLTTTYADRKESIFYAVFSAEIEYEWDETFDYGFRLQHRLSVSGDGVNETSLGLAVIYNL